MKQRTIAGTDLQSSVISLGGAALGSKISEEDSFRLMDLYADRGGNMIDTAQVYANWLPVEPSISETTIGKWMQARNNRSRMIVTTKGAHPHLKSMHSRMSREDITQDAEGSLRRLRVDAIDLYWLHRDDAGRPVEDILSTLNDLAKAGKIRYFGCSNWSAARIREAREFAARHRLQGFAANQMMWSLAAVDPAKLGDQTLAVMDEDMKRFHLETGLSAIPYSSQAQGLFTKWDRGAVSFDDDKVKAYYRLPENRLRLERLRKLSSATSFTVAQLVLGYLISQPFPTFPIAGCHTAEQLNESLDAAEVQLSSEQVNCLETGI